CEHSRCGREGRVWRQLAGEKHGQRGLQRVGGQGRGANAPGDRARTGGSAAVAAALTAGEKEARGHRAEQVGEEEKSSVHQGAAQGRGRSRWRWSRRRWVSRLATHPMTAAAKSRIGVTPSVASGAGSPVAVGCCSRRRARPSWVVTSRC